MFKQSLHRLETELARKSTMRSRFVALGKHKQVSREKKTSKYSRDGQGHTRASRFDFLEALSMHGV